MAMKRTYSSAGGVRRRMRRQNSLSQSQSQGSEEQDPFGFPDDSGGAGAGGSPRHGGDEDDDDDDGGGGGGGGGAASQSGLSSMAYHKMSTDTRRKGAAFHTKSSGRIRAQMDDLLFNMDGLCSGSLSAQRLSAANVASLCASAGVRMHMRMSKDDVVVKLLRTLTESATEDPELRLAASCILHLLSSDPANLEYFDGKSIGFLCSLIKSGGEDTAALALAAAAASPRTKSPAGAARAGGVPAIRMGNRMADGKSRQKSKAAESILPKLSAVFKETSLAHEKLSVATFALKSLVVLSDQHRLKDDFRSAGVLDRMAAMICDDVGRLRDGDAAGTARVLRSMMPCLHVLEKVTFLNEANACYLVATCSEVVVALLDTLAACDYGSEAGAAAAQNGGAAAPRKKPEPEGAATGSFDFGGSDDGDADGDEDEENDPRAIMSVVLRVLVNLTNDQPAGCAVVAKVNTKGGGGAAATASSGLQSVMNLVISALARGWRDGLVVCLALLVNLVEQSDECCQQLEDLELTPVGVEVKLGSLDNLLAQPTPALRFFCDLYISTCGSEESDDEEQKEPATAVAASSMPESQMPESEEEEDEDGDTATSIGIVSGYAAVLLGFVCLRQQGCAARVRGWLVSELRLAHLIASIRNFGVVHAEAGVLHEQQARFFDQMIECLEREQITLSQSQPD